MLASIEPGVMDEWIAFRRLEHDPMDRVCHILKFGFAALCAAKGLELAPDSFDVPVDGKPPVIAQPDIAGPAEAQALFCAVAVQAAGAR